MLSSKSIDKSVRFDNIIDNTLALRQDDSAFEVW